MNPAQANVTALAFVGDAVYELYIRNMICSDLSVGGNADLMHKKAIRYVRAESQAKAIKRMMNSFLTEDELGLVKRARNPISASKAVASLYSTAPALLLLLGVL